ncbi:unannotated protein [freshwater metagenome]|uniref:Unannotated protein n=1 Tax=freshwater metagenome TaxID=449393 RepID=A0A6J5YEV4_9ZZZZ
MKLGLSAPEIDCSNSPVAVDIWVMVPLPALATKKCPSYTTEVPGWSNPYESSE